MGASYEQDDHLLTLPGLSETDKMDLITAVSKGKGLEKTLVVLGKFRDDLDIAMREDEDFKRAFNQALRVRDEEIEIALHRKAKAGNVPAIKFWLVNRQSAEWQEARTVRHVGAEGGAIEVAHTAAAFRSILMSEDSRDDALTWIERGAAEAIEARSTPALPGGDAASGEDPESGEAG